MSTAHEIITLQLGKYSNFVGTHWWNMQESSFCYLPDNNLPLDINHDVTFREGLNVKGEVTYTPRVVLIDLQENYRSLRKESSLYRIDEDKSVTHWDGPVEVIKETPVKINPFLEETQTTTSADAAETKQNSRIELTELDSPSTSWSDYLKTHLHPNSFCFINETSSSEDTAPLQMYSNGEEVYNKSGESFEESIRKMAEECDYLQGFQMINDAYNGFSGISNKVLQHLEDEYKKRSSMCFPVYQDNLDYPIPDIKKQMHRLYAILQSMCSLNTYCTLFSPLSLTDDIVKLGHPYKTFPYLQYNEKLMYHTSAIFAAAIENLSAPSRLKSMKHSLYDVANSLTTYGRKLVCSSVCLPFPLSQDSYLNYMVKKDVPEYYMTSLTPFYKPDSERTLIQSAVLRGVKKNKFNRPDKFCNLLLESEEIFGEYLNKYSPSSAVTITVFNEKCSVSSPFPKIFKTSVSENGFSVSSNPASRRSVDKIAVSAAFNSSDSASQILKDLLTQADKVSFKEYVKCAEATYEKDSYGEMIENLIGLQDNYTNY